MTQEQWVKLSPEEQRIKVAKLCGWKNVQSRTIEDDEPYLDLVGNTPDNTLNTCHGRPRKISHYSGAEAVCVVSDYLNDLNAMHEAEILIGIGQISRYIRLLSDRTQITGMDVSRDDWASVHATAAQRAEAFVLAMEGAT